ncbi:aromatic ring-opening dioxygenase, catalytic subunit LigB [Halobacteriovorax sp. BALOs_7]|nr:aromatic ring-opening dioxygenase, catalytic subunit LigB [Halobacteriovorax sp. BALOs_7]
MKLGRRQAITGILFGLASAVLGRKFMTTKKERMPAIFLGHGSPMNAIESNDFTKKLEKLGQGLRRDYSRPKAVLMISAHWETEGTWVTGMDHPKTIHDFYGFPQALYDVRYPADGNASLADEIAKAINKPRVNIDKKQWGLDHGTWSVLKHVFPEADIPVVQLSLDRNQSYEYHYELGKKIRFLRDEGVMIMGSGNIVHNLRMMSRKHRYLGLDWAIEFDEWVKDKLLKREDAPLVSDALKTQAGKFSIPTDEHYLPLLYVLGSSLEEDKITFDYEGFELGSLSMRSVRYY